MLSSSTSDLRPAEALAEARRLRLEKLLQTAAHDFELRLAFGEHDALGPNRIILANAGDRPAAAPYFLLKGRALHLLGHYLHPEGREWVEAARREEAGGKPRFAALWHALEDARLENELVRRWPGANRILEVLKLPNLGGALLRRMPLNAQVEYGLYFSGRGFTGARFRSQVQAAVDQAAELIRGAAAGAGPGDSFQGMLAIYPLVAPLVSGRSQGGQERPSNQAQESDSQAGETVETPGREPPPGIPDFEIEDGVFEVDLLGQRQEFPEWFQPGSAPWFERGLGEKQVHPSAVCPDRQTIVDPPRGDLEAYRALRAEIEREAGFLAHRLTNLVREETYLRSGGQYRSGQLNMAKLWKQRTGNYRLFQRAVSGGSRMPAFSLLVDESASMKGQGKYRTATKAVILLGETLDLLGVPLEIIGYTTAEYEARAALKLGLTPAYEYRATRCSRLEHRLYKRFDEPYGSVRARLVGIEPRRNNWDEESLLFAYARLGARPERRKVLLVLSDGQPNGDAEHLIETVKRVENTGCKVIAFGIGADFVQQIYTDHIVVADFRQMAEGLLEILLREFRTL